METVLFFFFFLLLLNMQTILEV